MPSWQAKLMNAYIRFTFKRRVAGSEAEMVRYCRAKMEPAEFLRPRISKQITIEAVTEGAIKGEWLRPTGARHTTVYYLHGGGYVACTPATHRPFTAALAREANAQVFALDYRRAPEARFPAAVDDAVAGYRWLLANSTRPEDIVIGGDSAGGGLTLATLVSLRDAGVALPRAAFCLSPWTDLAATGASIQTNDGRDPMFYGDSIRNIAPVYAGSAPLDHPLVSPIHADLRGLPPLRIYVGSAEVLLDDSTRLAARAEAAGVEVDLRVWQEMVHVWPIFVGYGLPEARKTIAEIATFIRQQVQMPRARPLGIDRDLYQVPDDFDDPLPEELAYFNPQTNQSHSTE
jgi:acetyl esterase/lipase